MKNFNALVAIMAKLRDPNKGCPWDIEQNFASIVPHTIEEAYEVADAVERGDMQSLKEELGDLLLQVIFYSQMANEQGSFSISDVVETLNNKLIKRHPHVFGDVVINTGKEQEEAWEKQKQEERLTKAQKEGRQPSILDDVAVTLPAITRAVKLQKRAAKVGFNWPDAESIFAKIDEELAELKDAHKNGTNVAEEIGDLLFVISNLSIKFNLDPEECIRATNNKFISRFNHIEKRLNELGKAFEESSLEEMDKFWDEAKKFAKNC